MVRSSVGVRRAMRSFSSCMPSPVTALTVTKRSSDGGMRQLFPVSTASEMIFRNRPPDRRKKIAFVEDDQIGDLLFGEEIDHLFFRSGQSQSAVDDENSHIGTVENLFCFADSQFAQSPLVIDSRCVDNLYRTHRKEFHGFHNGIGGCPLYFGDYGEILLVTLLTTLDFPALRLSKKPIWTRSPDGVLFKLMKYHLTVSVF